jgi:hypothetical protein
MKKCCRILQDGPGAAGIVTVIHHVDHESLHLVLGDLAVSVQLLQHVNVAETVLRHELRQALSSDLVVLQFIQLVGSSNYSTNCADNTKLLSGNNVNVYL